jgi:hypothetical protein
MIYNVYFTILIHHLSGEVQINHTLVDVSIADAQLVGINVCHILLTLTPYSPVYIPGCEDIFHVLQDSSMALPGERKGKSGNGGIMHHDNLASLASFCEHSCSKILEMTWVAFFIWLELKLYG